MRDISRIEMEIHEELQHSGRTSFVIGLRTMQTQRVIIVVGSFAMYEAELQRRFPVVGTFSNCIEKLKEYGNPILSLRLKTYCKAINVLKHGQGHSYDWLLKQEEPLPFEMKQPDEHFFFEGDLSEVATLIRVDDDFIDDCITVLRDVTGYLDSLDTSLAL